MNQSIIETEQQEIKKDDRKKYNEGFRQHMKDSHYHRDYYHLTKQTIKCPICSKETTSRALQQHQNSVKMFINKK